MYLSDDAIDRQIETLNQVAESLMDLSTTLLSEAASQGETKAPVEDKYLSQALRAVTKAANVLKKVKA